MTHHAAQLARFITLISLAAITAACESSPPANDGGPAMRDSMVARDTGSGEESDAGSEPDSGALCWGAGETCATREHCCGELYCNYAAGVCQEEACAEPDEACSSDEDCCSGGCVIGADGTTGTCAPVGCIGDGNPLRRCTEDAECCHGHCNSYLGVCRATACVDEGASCTAHEECCSEQCRILSGSTGTCVVGCLTTNAACEVDIDCCFGGCVDGHCGCLASGQLCGTDSQCCSGTCATTGGRPTGVCE